MIYSRFIAALAVMLMPASFAHAATQDDSYIAGYAIGVLKHDLKLDTPSIIVQDGVITLPAGSLEVSEQAKVVKILPEIHTRAKHMEVPILKKGKSL